MMHIITIHAQTIKNSNCIFKAFEKHIEQTKFNHYKSTIGDFVLILNSLAFEEVAHSLYKIIKY